MGAITKLFLGLSDGLSTLSQIRTNAAFLEDSFRFLDIPNAMYQGSLTTEKRSDRQYEVEFRDVSFRYPGTDQWALRHVNLRFRVGSRLAVVGQNGSGKTTFIKLLCRLYDPTEGEILLNGIDIRKYRYDDYIGIFSVVFQDFKLFSLPVGENIGGRKDYDRQQAEACLRQAGLGERLSSMPQGLDTFLYKDLDQSGVDVSGGEAQKLAIARALYKDAPFIILDEPTAALDPIAEADIYSRFNDIAGDRTAIYISHRLSSCKFCDEIAVFDQGKYHPEGLPRGPAPRCVRPLPPALGRPGPVLRNRAAVLMIPAARHGRLIAAPTAENAACASVGADCISARIRPRFPPHHRRTL